MSDTIIAGAFTIWSLEDDSLDLLQDSDFEDMDFKPASLLAIYLLACHSPSEPLPPMTATALDLETGPVWTVQGLETVAVIDIKEKYKSDPVKLVQPLVKWAETFTDAGAESLVMGAYEHMGIDGDDGGLHLLIEMPMDGIQWDRPEDGVEEWLDALTDSVEEDLSRIDPDAEVILFDSENEVGPVMAGHIQVFSDNDPEEIVDAVRSAVLASFSAFAPQQKVQEALSVEIEGDCIYTLYADFMDDVED